MCIVAIEMYHVRLFFFYYEIHWHFGNETQPRTATAIFQIRV